MFCLLSLSGTLQIDLFDLHTHAKYNDGYKFVLCAMDSFSRFVWLWPQTSKRPEEVIAGLEQIMATGYTIDVIYCDKDGGFYNKKMDKWREANNIHMYSVQTKTKAAQVERFQKDLRLLVERLFFAGNTRRYLEQMHAFAKSHNTTRQTGT